jgi:hypothetical protein
VRIERARGRETFVPLAHPPGHAQVDFGEAVGVIGGVRQIYDVDDDVLDIGVRELLIHVKAFVAGGTFGRR